MLLPGVLRSDGIKAGAHQLTRHLVATRTATGVERSLGRNSRFDHRAGRCQLLRVVGFPSIFAWKSVSAEFRGYAPAKLASAFLFEVVFFATREDNEGNRAYTVRGRSGDSVLMHLPVHTLNSISGVSDNGRD